MLTGIRQAIRFGMRWLARDETTGCEWRSALVLAPHPDDETLGCGATILRKLAADTPVTVAVVTDGRHSHRSANVSPEALAALRWAEMAEAASRLGLASGDLRWAGFVDGALTGREDEVARYVERLVNEVRPEEVYTTSAMEPHPDHAALGRAAHRAVAAAQDPPRLLEYPVWLWGAWPLRRGDRLRSLLRAVALILRRRVVKVGAGRHLDAKLHALHAHSSQLARPSTVPVDEAWPGLPPQLLRAAAEESELFLDAGPATVARGQDPDRT